MMNGILRNVASKALVARSYPTLGLAFRGFNSANSAEVRDACRRRRGQL